MHNKIRHIIREHLKQLFEDVDFYGLQATVDQDGGINSGKLYKRQVQDYLRVLYNKLGVKPVKFLGAGHFGFAFLTDEGQTIKITSDKSEVVEAKKWMDKNPEHLPKIFNVFKIKVGDGSVEVYAIVKEYILQNNSFIKLIKNLESELDDWLSQYHVDKIEAPNSNSENIQKEIEEAFFWPNDADKFPTRIRELFNSLQDKQISPNEIAKFASYLKHNKVSNQLIWYFQQLYFLYEEMNSIGIKSSDTWAKNMGLRNKQLVYLDPGDGDKIGDGWIEKRHFDAEVAQENYLNEEQINTLLYHGSSEKFDAFSDEKQGAGEGGNLFGKGFYLTDSEEIAKFYALQVSKNDHISNYKPTGIFQSMEPVYTPDAEERARENMHINKFRVNGNFLDAESYILDDEFKNYLIELMEKHSGFKDSSRQIVNRTFDFLKNNKEKIRHYRGELEYVIKQLGMGNEEFVSGVRNYIISLGYDGVKYPSDKSYEGPGAHNYVVYNKRAIKLSK